jgi:hypothetical protein
VPRHVARSRQRAAKRAGAARLRYRGRRAVTGRAR